jgi:hypothetical protein
LAKIQERKLLETDLDWLKTIPTQKLIQRNAIEPQKDKVLLQPFQGSTFISFSAQEF